MNALSCATLGDVLRFHARHRPDKPAFETAGGASVTFGQFNSRVNRLCSALGERGLRKGDRVAVLSRNRPEYVEVFGVAKAGLVAVPLNWRLAEAELARLLVHSAPQVLIVDEAYKEVAERLRPLLPDLRHFVLLGPEGAGREELPDAERPGWTAYEDLLRRAADDEPEALVAPGDAMCLVYTSGTTGAPKGVTLTHRGMLDNCHASATEVLALTEDDYSLAVLPLFHVGGMWYHLFPCFAAGCTTLLMAEFEPGALLRELQARKVTNVHVVPTMINAMLNHPLAATANLSHLRLIFYAASSMPAELLRRAMQCFSRSGFVQSYGSTEAGMVTVLSVADHLRASEPGGEHLLSSCGRVLKERQVRIVDDAGTELRHGQIGAISSYCPGVMAGYWHDGNATAKVLQDGWLDTGDLGYVDGDGYLYLVDRKNDMVVTGGENVYPSEVEACFYQDPAVLEAAVFGVADPLWVERVVAAVVLRPGFEANEQALMQRIRSHLAAYKCPKNIFFTTDLPKSGAGKVLRKELRKKYGASEL